MIYQLSSGKTIEITLEQYLDLTDEDIEYLIAYNIGDEIDNPFFSSSFTHKQVNLVEDDKNEEVLDLLDTDIVQKLTDLDLDKTMLEE